MNIFKLRFPVLSFLAFLIIPVAHSETIRFDPPNPTGSRSVDAIITGVWPNACLPVVKNVVITSATITLHLDATPPRGLLCAQSTGPYARTFHLGIAPPGGYIVILVADALTTSTELARAPLIVRDAETMTIVPYAVPVTGGKFLVTSPIQSQTLTIGGVTVPVGFGTDEPPLVVAPPHAAGAVDLVTDSASGSVTAKAALIYYDPASVDPAVFEPILFAVSFQGPGALGSQWLTENFIGSSAKRTDPAAFFRDPLPCTDCSTALNLSSQQLLNNGSAWGHVLYAMRGTTDMLSFASRIRDTSRQALTAGTEVPVVREGDFRPLLRFMNIPVDPKYRVTLRLWALGDYPQYIFAIDAVPALQNSLSLTRIPGTSMWFGSADVTSTIKLADGNPTNLLVTPASYGTNHPALAPAIWGMLSITNNETQQVTIVSTR